MFGKQKIKTKSVHMHTGKIFFAVVLMCAYVIGLSLFAGQVQTADAAIPKYINFQGKLTAVSNGSNVANGSYSFEFKLYDAVSGGSLLWTETWDGSPAQCPQLAVAQGVFNAKLGACEPLTSVDFTGGALYLTVNFNPGAGFDGEMAPRKQLVSSAYAFVANGVSGDGVVNNAVSSATALSVADVGSSDYAFQVDTSAATAVTGLKVTSAAAAGGLALTTISSGANENLTMDAKGSGTISLGGTSTGNVLFGGGYGLTGASITSAGNISTNGTLLTDTSVSTPSIITASGALGITPASGSNVNITLATTGDFAVNTSQLYVDTSTARVGIGTASPSGKLHIYSAGGLNSGINLEATSAAAYAVIDFNTDAGLAGQFLATGSSFSNGIFTGDQLALANYLTNGSTTLVAGGTNGFINFATGGYLTGNERMRIDPTGKVGIGDTTPAALLTVGSGDLFQVNSSGAIAAVVGITSAGAAVSLNNNSNFNVDIATGTSTGTITLGGTGTQAIDIGAGVAAKTITIGNANDDTFSINSSGLDVSTAGAITNATGFNGLVVTANTGVVTTGTWNGTAIGAQYGGTGLNTSASSGVPSINSGTWSANAITQNGVMYGGALNALSFTAVGTTGQCLVGNTGAAPSWSSCAGLVTLQAAYDATSGNTITTTDARNIAITLANVTTPTSLTIENQDTAATSAQRIFNSIATGTATNGLLIEQTGAGTMTNAIQIAETAGTITDGILITGTLGNILNSGSIDITGAGAITGSTGFNGLVVTANTGVVTTGTWNGTAVVDTYVADTLTIDSSSSVHWNALNNYPAACSAGSAISQLADTTNTCTAFNTDTSITLQDAYTAGNSIETATNTSVVITETTTGAVTGDLLQLTVNQATGGTYSGDALQITMDGFDANSYTGNGINIVIDQSQNTGSPILVQDDAATTLFQLSENGAITLGAASAETTAITITDTDYTNALSIGDNNILGTTSAIDFTNFDVSSAGAIVGVGVNSGSGLLQGTGGLTLTGAISVTNNGSSTVDINTGTSTGLVTIGGGSGTFSLQTTNIDISNTGAITGSTGFNGLVVTANTGVVTTGTWNGSLITGTYGGTGVNNGASTITLGGNLITSGAFATTLTSTATTNVTLPTSGTLYGTATGSITSNQLLTSLTDETGSGLAVFGTSPTFSASAIFSGLTASSAVYTDGSKSLTSTAPTSGAIGYWSRTGTVLSQTTANDTISLSGNAGDIITVASSATGAANKSINISQTGATAGTDYAGYFSNTGAATTNVGLYSTASGGTNNYAAIFDAGNVGVGGTPNGANGILQVTGSLGMTGNTEIRQSTNADGNTLRVLATQLVAGNSNAVGYGYAGGGLVAGVSPSASTLLLDVGGSDAGTAHRLKVANDGSGVTGTLFYGTPSLTTLYGDSSTGLVGVGTNAPGSYDVGITKAVVLSTASSGLSIISGTASYGALYFGDGTDGTDAAYRGGVEYYHSTDSMKIWAGASSATPNLFLTSTGTVGIGTTGPDRRLDVLDASNPQIRLTTTDGTVYSDLQNTATANLIVTGDSLTSSSAKEYGLQISPTINQTSTASYTALDINVTETAATTANGLNRLADFKVGGSSKLAVANNGAVTLQNAASLTTAYGGFGKIENHLTKSEEFDHANWTKSSVTAPTANTQVSPDGSTTAESLATSGSGGYVQQDTSTAVSSTDYTFSVWARSASGTQSFSMRVDGTTTGTGTEITHTATTSWQRFSVTQAVGGFTGNVRVRIYPGTSASTGTIYAWGAQVEKSSVPNTYAKTTTAGLTNDTSRGLAVNNNMLNTTASGYVYGGRQINTIDSTTAGTHIGQFIRMLDNTSLDSGQNVRGLEVQAYSGTNVNGTNTGIAAYGYTFGLQATTTSQAAAQATPAAIFADLDNGTDATTKARGNAIRAYTDNATSADLVSFYQETSTYTGNGLLMNFGNGGGSFSGNFVNLQNAATSKYTISSAGRHDFLTADADNVIPIYINSEESTVTQTLFAIESDTVANGQTVDTVKAHFEADGSLFVSLTGTQNTVALCHANNGQSNNDEIVDCSGAPSDVAEYFGSEDSTLTAGEIVVVGKNATEMHLDGYHTSKAWIARSTGSYQDTLMGVISTAPAAVYGDEIFSASENPRPVALVGRVPVKVNLENGPIKAGDFITSSSTPGVGMKATKSGPVIGQALDKYDGNNEIGTIIVFIKPTNYNGVEIDDQLAGLQFDFTGTEEGLVNSAENSNAILEHLLSQLPTLDPNNLNQVNTDIVIAGGEIITPTVTTQTLRADFLTSATAEGGLEVASTTMFNGGLLVDSISSIGDLLSFSSDVEFFGTPYFTADTAGFAVVQTGAQSVDVVFGREYLAQPIVSASISFEQDVDQSLLDQEARDVLKANSVSEAQLFLNDQVSYVVTNKSKFGFTIVLNKPATRDIKLSWVALAVRNATTFMSLEGQEVTPNDSNPGDVAGDFTPDPVLDPVTPPDGSGDVVVPDPVTPPTDGGADPVL